MISLNLISSNKTFVEILIYYCKIVIHLLNPILSKMDLRADTIKFLFSINFYYLMAFLNVIKSTIWWHLKQLKSTVKMSWWLIEGINVCKISSTQLNKMFILKLIIKFTIMSCNNQAIIVNKRIYYTAIYANSMNLLSKLNTSETIILIHSFGWIQLI